MKLVYAGTPAFACPPLLAIYEHGFEISAVLTQPDRPQGRKGILTPPPVKKEALSRGIRVLQPERLRTDLAALRETGADLMVTCAYGQILTQEVLDLFPMGVWNIHASLLPDYRGAAPIPRAILDGKTETGITIMRTELGLDTGDILTARSLPISDMDTAETLSGRLSLLAAEMIPEALDTIARGDFVLKKQGDGFTCKKVARTEVDFSRSAREVSCLIRGLSPSPGSFGVCGGILLNLCFAAETACDADVPAGTVVEASPKRGLVVKCGTGAVRLSEVQLAGGKRMADTAFLNGGKLRVGMKFERLS